MESVIGARAVRISRALADGTPDYGNSAGALVVRGGISTFEHGFEVEEGSNIFDRDAAGAACVIRKREDTVKWTTFTLTLCRDDPRLTEIILHGNATLLTDVNDYPIGRGISAGGGCGESADSNGVIIELWSDLWDCDAPKADYPYVRSVLPRAYLTPQGYTREDGTSLPMYSGFAQANANIGNGPFDDFDVTEDVADLVYFDIYDDALPDATVPFDYIAIPAS